MAKGKDICERTFQFALRIVKFCKHLENTPGVGRVLSRQLLRSGTSIGANVEEGQGGQSRADFISKYSIARKEAREANYWLRLLEAAGIATSKQVEGLKDESGQLIAILTTIIKKTEKNKEKSI